MMAFECEETTRICARLTIFSRRPGFRHKAGVADDFVEQKNLRLPKRRDRERQVQIKHFEKRSPRPEFFQICIGP